MKEFRNFIVSNEFKPNTMVRSVADVLDKMQNDGLLKKTDGLNNAWSLVQDKVGTGQKDASEFFVTLVDTMESQLSSEKQQDIRKIVKFTLHSHTRSPEGNVLHVTPPGERGSIIIGSILQGDTVEKDIPSLIYYAYQPNRLESYVDWENLVLYINPTTKPEEKENIINQTTGSQLLTVDNRAVKKVETISSLPRYLFINLWPYDVNQSNPVSFTRWDEDIVVTDTLTFTRFDRDAHQNLIPIIYPEAEEDTVTYKLNSAAMYSGSGTAGHYWAYVQRDNIWYYCNDAIVQERQFPYTFKKDDPFPYLLFYERVDEQDEQIETFKQAAEVDALHDVYRHVHLLWQAVAQR